MFYLGNFTQTFCDLGKYTRTN